MANFMKDEKDKTVQILERISGVDEEDLFWLRIDTGEQYLRKLIHHPEKYREVRNNKAFWLWWNRVYNITDSYILERMNSLKYDTCNDVWYKDAQQMVFNSMAWDIPDLIRKDLKLPKRKYRSRTKKATVI